MMDPAETPDILELHGLGGLYNGERYTVAAGTSATAGSSSLATCPVTRCRNFARLEGLALRDELQKALAPEHLRFLNVGDGRLFIENLAGREVRAGGRAITDRLEVDLRLGPVVVEFGFGERLIATFPGDLTDPQELGTPRKEPARNALAATLTTHGEPPRPEDLDPPLQLYPSAAEGVSPEPDNGSRGEQIPAHPPGATAPVPPAQPTPPTSSAPATPKAAPAEPGRRRFRSGSRGAVFFSILLHVVIILGLFSYIASGLVPAPGSRITDMSMETPTTLPTMMPPNPIEQDPTPSEAPDAETELPSVTDDEIPAEFSDGPGFDDALDQGLPGTASGSLGGAIGLGPGGQFGGGVPGGGSGRVRPSNPSPGVQKPLWLALDWLRRHQDDDGSWGGISSLKNCSACTGNGKRDYRIAQTGLAMLAFVGAGHTHRDGEFKDTVRSATKFLMRRCGEDGSFHGEEASAMDRRMYGQAMAVLAIAELYRQSKSPLLKKVLTRGVRFIERAQTPYAGWRYQANGRNSDTSVTGWQVLALYAAKRAGIAVNPATRSGARSWLASMTENRTWRVGYNRRGRGSLAMTATGLTMNFLLGLPSSNPAFRGGFRILAENRPVWPPQGTPEEQTGGADLYYWYFGTLATAKKRDSNWPPWRKALRGVLLSNQETQADAKGSWPAAGQWESVGGRVLSTSLGALCLELAEGMKTAFK